jgi:hypothetical protein
VRAVPERNSDGIGKERHQLLGLGRVEVKPNPVVEDQTNMVFVIASKACFHEGDAPAIHNDVMGLERPWEGNPKALID